MGRKVRDASNLAVVRNAEAEVAEPKTAVEYAMDQTRTVIDACTGRKLMSRLEYEDFLELLRDDIVDRLLSVGEELDAEADAMADADDELDAGETP